MSTLTWPQGRMWPAPLRIPHTLLDSLRTASPRTGDFSRLLRRHSDSSKSPESSKRLRSTFQSPDFWRCQRIDRNRRVCARFAIARGPGERLGRRKSAESGKTYPGAILLGPWIIAVDSPGAGTPDYLRARSTSKVIAGSPAGVV